MPRRLIYAPRAREDLDDARRWLTQPGSGPAAWAKLDAILSAIESLRDQPCRWPPGRHPGVRERLCAGGWRAFYEVDPDTGRDENAGDVRVLRIYGPGHDRRGFRRSQPPTRSPEALSRGQDARPGNLPAEGVGESGRLAAKPLRRLGELAILTTEIASARRIHA